EAEPRSDAAATPEALFVFEREDVRQRSQRTDAADLRERFGVRIAILGELRDLPVKLADASSELLDHFNQRQQSLTQAIRKTHGGAFVKCLGGSGGDALADGLDHRANVLNQS